jgi:hypothetical protein
LLLVITSQAMCQLTMHSFILAISANTGNVDLQKNGPCNMGFTEETEPDPFDERVIVMIEICQLINN